MDYANRSRPPKKKPTAQKKTTKQTKRGASRQRNQKPVPWLVVAVAVALVAGLGWFLTSINGASEQGSTTPPPAAVIAPTDNVNGLPEKPEERWQYIEELENKEVEVDVPERELGPPKLMQCGSFRSSEDAQAMRANIAMVGLESQVRESNGNNGRWFRVILGPYESKRDAERDRHKLQRAQIFGCQIWNWNLDQL